jgi:hypothetical protein
MVWHLRTGSSVLPRQQVWAETMGPADVFGKKKKKGPTFDASPVLDQSDHPVLSSSGIGTITRAAISNTQ